MWCFVVLALLFFVGHWWMQRMDEVLTAYLDVLVEKRLKQDMMVVLQGVVDTIDYDYQKMMEMQTSSDGYITSISYDSKYLQQVLSQIISQAEVELTKNREFQYEIKMGMFTQNIYLAQTGPSLQLSLRTQPYLQAALNIEMKPYGMNSSLLLIGVDIDVYLYTVSPMIQKAVMVSCYVPLVIQVVTGKMPIGYPYDLQEMTIVG